MDAGRATPFNVNGQLRRNSGRTNKPYVNQKSSQWSPTNSRNRRALGEKNELGSVIFGCINATYNECVNTGLFGLPESHLSYVKHILPGMPLFYFNYQTREMLGIFEATSKGCLNINPFAWSGVSTSHGHGGYPAQVRVQLRSDFEEILSLPEKTFRNSINDNYYTNTRFHFELTFSQTGRLIALFERAVGNLNRRVVQMNVPDAHTRAASSSKRTASTNMPSSHVPPLLSNISNFSGQFGNLAVSEKFHETVQGDVFPAESLKWYDYQASQDIYLIGGFIGWSSDQLLSLAKVIVWSPATGTLQIKADMHIPRCSATASVLDGHIFVLGGRDGVAWLDTVEKYDKNRDHWFMCQPMTTKRGNLGSVTLGGRTFAIGGENDQACLSEVEGYDPYLGGWIRCASMLEKRCSLAAVECGGVLYALGGSDGEQPLRSMERFDPREPVWTRMPSMSMQRDGLSAALLNGKIYALGGVTQHRILNTVEVFDPRANRWDMAQNMAYSSLGGATVVLGETLYHIGGHLEYENPNVIHRFTEATGWWSAHACITDRRQALAAVVF